jgi:DNA (cytosine-5)-methyltransferase 1
LGPYEVVDLLGELAASVRAQLEAASTDVQHAAIGYVMEAAADGEVGDNIPGARKLTDNALAILSGMVVGCWFNGLDWHRSVRMAG